MYHLWDSRQSINASPAINRKPGTLIHRGINMPFIITSQPKIKRRRCMEAIIKKKKLPIVVKGFTILPLYSQDVGFFCILSFVLHTIIASFKKEKRKDCCFSGLS
jgi:hypothetical protein